MNYLMRQKSTPVLNILYWDSSSAITWVFSVKCPWHSNYCMSNINYTNIFLPVSQIQWSFSLALHDLNHFLLPTWLLILWAKWRCLSTNSWFNIKTHKYFTKIVSSYVLTHTYTCTCTLILKFWWISLNNLDVVCV